MEKKNFVLRVDSHMYEALCRWAADDFRSVNGQVEWLLHQALKAHGRLPKTGGRDCGEERKKGQK